MSRGLRLKASQRRFTRAYMLERQNHRCCTCGIRMDGVNQTDDNFPTFEHVIPHRFGGPANRLNGVFTCARCNTEDRAWIIWRNFCRENDLPVNWHLMS